MPDFTTKLKRDKNGYNYSVSPWMQLLKASKGACPTITFVESLGDANSSTQNQINKPASNNRRILIEARFHFVATAEEHEEKC